jgi:hypothetical protein
MPYFYTKNEMPIMSMFAKKPSIINKTFSKGLVMSKSILPSMIRKQIIGSNGMGIRKV